MQARIGFLDFKTRTPHTNHSSVCRFLNKRDRQHSRFSRNAQIEDLTIENNDFDNNICIKFSLDSGQMYRTVLLSISKKLGRLVAGLNDRALTQGDNINQNFTLLKQIPPMKRFRQHDEVNLAGVVTEQRQMNVYITRFSQRVHGMVKWRKKRIAFTLWPPTVLMATQRDSLAQFGIINSN